MIDNQRTKSAKKRNLMIARFLVAMLMFGGLVMQPKVEEKVEAQTECRPSSTLPIASILQFANLTMIGANNFRVDMRVRPQHRLVCSFLSPCNPDKYTFKPNGSSSNIIGVDVIDACNGSFLLQTTPFPSSSQSLWF
ncbi:MAG: hypothetical protein HY231_26275 [Acidobacteria bacterium]|nr:hypothetical protein [Acidobacteriota bacterium]